jgi:hypothetical protein
MTSSTFAWLVSVDRDCATFSHTLGLYSQFRIHQQTARAQFAQTLFYALTPISHVIYYIHDRYT